MLQQRLTLVLIAALTLISVCGPLYVVFENFNSKKDKQITFARVAIDDAILKTRGFAAFGEGDLLVCNNPDGQVYSPTARGCHVGSEKAELWSVDASNSCLEAEFISSQNKLFLGKICNLWAFVEVDGTRFFQLPDPEVFSSLQIQSVFIDSSEPFAAVLSRQLEFSSLGKADIEETDAAESPKPIMVQLANSGPSPLEFVPSIIGAIIGVLTFILYWRSQMPPPTQGTAGDTEFEEIKLQSDT